MAAPVPDQCLKRINDFIHNFIDKPHEYTPDFISKQMGHTINDNTFSRYHILWYSILLIISYQMIIMPLVLRFYCRSQTRRRLAPLILYFAFCVCGMLVRDLVFGVYMGSMILLNDYSLSFNFTNNCALFGYLSLYSNILMPFILIIYSIVLKSGLIYSLFFTVIFATCMGFYLNLDTASLGYKAFLSLVPLYIGSLLFLILSFGFMQAIFNVEQPKQCVQDEGKENK